MKHTKHTILRLIRLIRHIKSGKFSWFVSELISVIPDSILLFFNYCPYCRSCSITVDRRRTRTMYQDDKSNYEISCIDCYEEHDQDWRERWDEYYREIGY